MNLDTFRRVRDEFALAEYAERLPKLKAEAKRLRAIVDPAFESLRALRVQRKGFSAASNRQHYEQLTHKIREADEHLRPYWQQLAPIEAQIAVIERDIPIRRARRYEAGRDVPDWFIQQAKEQET